jgi:DNA-binding response OmpR family regulator
LSCLKSPSPLPTNGNVLLIDDNTFVLDMLYAAKFIRSGYTIEAVTSAAGGIATLRDGFVADAIVFNLTMAERDGFSFLQTILKEHPHAALIALTNRPDIDKKTGAQLGAAYYIVKATATPADVVAAVGDIIAKRSAQ